MITNAAVTKPAEVVLLAFRTLSLSTTIAERDTQWPVVQLVVIATVPVHPHIHTDVLGKNKPYPKSRYNRGVPDSKVCFTKSFFSQSCSDPF